MLVPAIDVVDALHVGRAIGDQAGQDEARGSAQVRRHHGRAGEPRHAVNHGGVPLDADVGAEAAQLQHVHEAVLEDRLDDRADAVGDRVERGELRLHVGGKSRMRRGAQVDGARPAFHVDLDPVRADGDPGAGLAQLRDHGIEVRGLGPDDSHVPAGNGAGDQEGAGLDAVRQHAVLAAA